MQQLNFVSALVLSTFYNFTFFQKVYTAYAMDQMVWLHVTSLYVVLTAVIYLLLLVIATGPWQKYVLAIVFMTSAGVSYYSQNFGTVFDREMILNIVNTDTKEVRDLLTPRLGINLLFFGIFPMLVLWRVELFKETSAILLRKTARNFLLTFAVIFTVMLPLSRFYASFLRENKSLRFYSNPTFPIYSVVSFFFDESEVSPVEAAEIGKGSHLSEQDNTRDLVVFVLGEAARAKNFSLNGYEKETSPLLKKEKVISFANMYSCGTSTATSVPCMFSIFGRDAYTHRKAEHTQNLVDVLSNTGEIDVLWRDNNSDSKGVAVRVPYEGFKSHHKNSVCDEECRDIGMLDGLQEYIDASRKKDVFIVLHQMGNHGPAYFKRYPKEFEKFTPACHSAELSDCTQAEIANAYDNALLYTDYFLAHVIQLLKNNEGKFETAMLYVSDHGESLGEKGIYLHGLPYMLAPDEQKHVGAIFWFGNQMRHELVMNQLEARSHLRFSHDNLFHSVLGLFEIESSLYDKSKDLFH